MGERKIAAVILAGGHSSRMGRDKALLDYNGKPLLDHMIGLLEQVGLNDIYISGDFKGYHCIPDSTPHEGPARAISDVLRTLESYDGVLFLPVDMPLLQRKALHLLLKQENGAYFTGFPLPAFITNFCVKERSKSVKSLLIDLKISSIILPSELERSMINTNTPEDWAEALRA